MFGWGALGAKWVHILHKLPTQPAGYMINNQLVKAPTPWEHPRYGSVDVNKLSMLENILCSTHLLQGLK